MEIKCTPQELKELLQNETLIAGTTRVLLDKEEIISSLEKYQNCRTTNCDKLQ